MPKSFKSSMTASIPISISCALAGVLCLATPVLAQAKKINIGYASATDFLPAFIARENGCFAKGDLDVTLTRVAVASNIPAALMSGSMQIGMGTGTILLQAVEGGLDLVAVAGATRMLRSNVTMSLVVRNGIEVKVAVDLKGKKIGVPGINSVGDVMLRKWLKDAGLKPGEVTFIEAPFPAMNDLLKAGTVDAVIAAEPIRSMIVGAGTGYRMPIEYYVALEPDTILAFWQASSKWATENKAAVQTFRSCLVEGLKFARENVEKSKEIEKQYIGFNTPVMPTMTTDAKPEDFVFFVKLAREMGLISKDIDVKTLVAP